MSVKSKLKYSEELIMDYLQGHNYNSRGERIFNTSNFGRQLYNEFALSGIENKDFPKNAIFNYFGISKKDKQDYDNIQSDGTRKLSSDELLKKYNLTRSEFNDKFKEIGNIFDKKIKNGKLNFVNRFNSEEDIYEYVQTKFNAVCSN